MESDRVYLAVSYSEKDDAKSLGARWDSDAKRWYGTSDDDELLAKYEMIHLSVPFDQKDVAKKMGAMWDSSKKSWYCSNSNLALKQMFKRQHPTGTATGAAGLSATGAAVPVSSSAFANFTRLPTGPRLKPSAKGAGWGQVMLPREGDF